MGLGRVLHQLRHKVHPLGHPCLLVQDVVLRATLHVLVVHHHVETLAGKVPVAQPSSHQGLVPAASIWSDGTGQMCKAYF